MTRAFRKPYVAVLNRKQPLTRGLQFAQMSGWQKGFVIDGATEFVERENVRLQRGFIDGSPAGTYDQSDLGRGISSGSSADAIRYNSILGYYDPSPEDVRGFSAAILFRPTALNASSADDWVFGKRTATGGAIGWCIVYDTVANEWMFKWEDSGAVNDDLTAPAPTPSTERTDLIVCTLSADDGAGNHTAKIYVNGVLRASKTTTEGIGDNTRPVSIFDDTQSDDVQEGISGMAAIWERELSQSEQKQLWTDPYILWKGAFEKRYVNPFGSREAAQFQTFFLSF